MIARFLILFLLFQSSLAYSQSWATGASWHYENRYPFQNLGSYFLLEYEKDTVVLGKTCSKIKAVNEWKCSARGSLWDPILTYLSNDSLYFLYYSGSVPRFQMHYNWAAQKGDSWLVMNEFGTHYDSVIIQVDSTFTTVFNGINLRSFSLSHFDGRDTSLIASNRTVIESIGDLHYFYGTDYGIPTCDMPYPIGLRCYSDPVIGSNGPFKHLPADSCNEIRDYSSVSEIASSTAVSIFPNPTSGQLSLNFKNELNGEIQVYNTNGELIFRSVFQPTINTKINLPNSLKKGLYLVKVVSDQNVYSERIILER